MRVVTIIEMSWQVNEEASRDVTGEANRMNQGGDSRARVMHIWMSDLWFSMRKGDNRWGAGTARGLNRDQIVKIARLTGCKNFVGKRKKLLDNYIYIITYQQYQLLTELLISTINIIDIINRLNSYINNLFNANMNWQSVNWIVDITISNYCYGQW